MFRRNKKNLPKFQDYDELIVSIANAKAQYKKKFNILSSVESSIQNCHECIGTYVTTDNPALKVNEIENVKINNFINSFSIEIDFYSTSE